MHGLCVCVRVLQNHPGSVEETRVSWADAFVVVYSICSRRSFTTARELILKLAKLRGATFPPVLLLGNMSDLEHRREVGVEEGHEVALEHGCQYYEVSAADSALSVSIAFHAFLREARIAQQQRAALLKRRRSSLGSVSKKLGAMFGKNSSSNKDSNGDSDKRRMPLAGGNSNGDSDKRRMPLAGGNSNGDSDKRRMSLTGGNSNGDSDKRRMSLTGGNSNGDSDKRRMFLASSNKDCNGDSDRRRLSVDIVDKKS